MWHQRLWKLQCFGRVKQQLRVNCRAGIRFPSPASPALIWETKEMKIRCPILSIMPHSLTLNPWHLVSLDGWGRSYPEYSYSLLSHPHGGEQDRSSLKPRGTAFLRGLGSEKWWRTQFKIRYHMNSGLVSFNEIRKYLSDKLRETAIFCPIRIWKAYFDSIQRSVNGSLVLIGHTKGSVHFIVFFSQSCWQFLMD